MAIVIDGGCVYRPDIGPTTWLYEVEDSSGIHQNLFTASVKPEVGDSISEGVLVPLLGYRIVEDPNSRLRKRIREEAEYNPD